jgi:hypothetical protein
MDPGLAGDQLREQVARAEMVARVRPQQRRAQRLAPLEVAETPRADHQPVQIAQKRSVIHPPPREHTIEVLWQRLLDHIPRIRVITAREPLLELIATPRTPSDHLHERHGDNTPRLAPVLIAGDSHPTLVHPQRRASELDRGWRTRNVAEAMALTSTA